mmetsp:Transcript_28388/g.39506  ORF Transcript_28388/g.39506 Transcript_28388/m.39506 type:complete len:88 (+) Transcript_28388:147-410(+)
MHSLHSTSIRHVPSTSFAARTGADATASWASKIFSRVLLRCTAVYSVTDEAVLAIFFPALAASNHLGAMSEEMLWFLELTLVTRSFG